MQKALVVCTHSHDPFFQGLKELNDLLEKGWIVVSSNPMGTGHNDYAFSLVIVENKLLK